jgi:hypothetical protein
MRTTITLEDDVALMLEKLQKDEQKSFKQIVNEVLRRGLVERRPAGKKESRYSTPELRPGPCKYPDLDNVAEVLAVAEGEDYS